MPQSAAAKARQRKRRIIDFTLVVLYYVIGIFVWNALEDWNVLEACYYMTVTMSTVGYGDYSPQTQGGQIFGIFWLFIGIGVIFEIVARIAGDVVENSMDKLEDAMSPDTEAKVQPVWPQLAAAVVALLVCIFGGVLFFSLNEPDNFTFLEALWWCVATVTTVGYGDLEHTKDSSKIFSIFYIVVTVVVGAASLGIVGAVREQKRQERREAEILSRMNVSMLSDMDKEGNGVDINEYLVGMIKMLELVDESKLDLLRARFKEFDKDGSGRLCNADLKLLAEKEIDKRRTNIEGGNMGRPKKVAPVTNDSGKVGGVYASGGDKNSPRGRGEDASDSFEPLVVQDI